MRWPIFQAMGLIDVQRTTPEELNTFVGRSRELAQARSMLAGAPLLTLTGTGGVGKTRLAMRLARELATAFPDGVVTVPLSGLSAPGLVAGTVAEALGLHDRAGRRTLDDLFAHLRTRHLLLVVDDCEHVVDECGPLVAQLLRAAPLLKVVATSRQPLGVAGEQLLPVPALSVPEHDSDTARAVGQSEAVVLLLDRANALGLRLEVDDGNASELARLCRRLDGVPLAIELAAARLRELSVTQLVERMDDRFALLTDGSTSSVPRQRTLQSSVDWSFDLCAADEQQVWLRLSVFEGSFDLDAAEYVCGSGADGLSTVFENVAALVDKSVLQPEEHAGQVRYRMLESIREYGRRRLAGQPGAGPVRLLHRRWFVDLATRAGEGWFGTEHARWLSRLRADEADLRAAHAQALGGGDARDALLLAASVWFYWVANGSLTEGRRWIADGLAAHPAGVDAALRVRAWRLLGLLGANQGDPPAALAALVACQDEATVAAVAPGVDPATAAAVRADGTWAAGLAAAVTGDHAAAIELFESVVAEDTALEPDAVVLALQVLVTMFTQMREGERAVSCAERALAICDEHAERWTRADLLTLYGTELWRQGRLNLATEAAREALTIADSLGHVLGALNALELLTWVMSSGRDDEQAAVLLGALPGLWASVGAPPQATAAGADYRTPCDAAVRARLGDAAYAVARQRGQELDLGAAVELCLDEKPARQHGRTHRWSGPTDLTPREIEVAELIARGMTNKAIAQQLVIAQRTAEGHVERILDKLNLSSRAGIASWVAQHRRTFTDSRAAAHDAPRPSGR